MVSPYPSAFLHGSIVYVNVFDLASQLVSLIPSKKDYLASSSDPITSFLLKHIFC